LAARPRIGQGIGRSKGMTLGKARSSGANNTRVKSPSPSGIKPSGSVGVYIIAGRRHAAGILDRSDRWLALADL
jgi:hypothetical protein